MRKIKYIYIIKLLVLIAFCGLSYFSAEAQKAKSWGIETSAYFGQILKHTPDILFDVNHVSKGLSFNFKYQTYGKEKWSQYQRYPEMAVALVYFNFGDNDVLGQSIAIMPNVSVNILRKKKGYIYFQLGTGLAYLNRPYNAVSNPKNNGIGSRWNNITMIQFVGGFRINDAWSTQLGMGLTHYSNGGTGLPNYGLNILMGSIGLKYTPNPVKQEDYIWDEDFLNIPEKRWGCQMHLDLAYGEFGAAGGPRFPIYIGSVAGTFHFNRVNRMLFGLEAEYNTGVYHLINHASANSDKDYARSQARRVMFFVADEFLFGDFGILVQAGFYFKQKERLAGKIYNKLAVRYYFPPLGKPKTQFFAAIYLKTHISVAEYIAIGMGANL